MTKTETVPAEPAKAADLLLPDPADQPSHLRLRALELAVQAGGKAVGRNWDPLAEARRYLDFLLNG